MSEARHILLAAGGTGGHLFPAFALAEALLRRGHTVDLASDERIADYGRDFPARQIHTITSGTITGRSPFALAVTGAKLSKGIAEAASLIGRTKPAAVVGFGGYPSFPPVMAARLRGVPSALHEQNAVLGRANRMLAKRVTALATSFEEVKFADAIPAERVTFTGNPVRAVVIAASRHPFDAPVADGPFHLLVFGGSQGARVFSERMPEAVALLSPEMRARLRITQQCRAEDLDAVQTRYHALGVAAQCATFFPDLPQRIAGSHLVIARSGASTIAELTVIGRPSFLVPLPHALDNDQLQNATKLHAAGGCWWAAQEDFGAERIARDLHHLIAAPEQLIPVADASARQGRADADERLADLVERIIG